jgi:predicted dehydrogenase
MDRMKIGIIGCGNISNQYMRNVKDYPILDLVACADLNMDAARSQAEKWNIPRACTVDELLADASIELTVNLTIPAAHADIAIRSMAAGKHTYHEKPFAVTRAEADAILAQAKASGLRVGCAPDTFLGAGIQTARKAIDDGLIGTPTCVTAFMMGAGHESWHPSPEFYYKPGGGPMLDMGPYYLTALVNLLGPIEAVSGATRITRPTRTITSEPKRGQVITVETPDHVQGNLYFAGGVTGMIVTSFAVKAGLHPPITIFGTDGVLAVPDPNGFDGEVKLLRERRGEWETIPHAFPTGFGRMIGVADMAHAIRDNRPHRASGELAATVLDAMLGFLDSGADRSTYSLQSRCDRPAPLPTDLKEGLIHA